MDLTLREILDRYGPTLALIGALVVLVAVFPASKSAEEQGQLTTTGAGTVAVEGPGGAIPDTGAGAAGDGGGGRARLGAGRTAAGTGGGTGAIATGPQAAQGPKNCRPDGRQLGVSRYLPPCVALFQGDNGGATARGVHPDKVVVVRFMAQVAAATQAALVAAGADDEREDQDRMDAALIDYFNDHYETYGREVQVVTMEATGASTNDSAMRADAKTIADTHKAFAMWFGSGASETLTEEVAARGVVCLCTTSLSDRFYAENRGKIFASLPSQEEYYTAMAEYIGKRLAGKPAKHAGTGIQGQPRKIGLLYWEASSNGPRRDAKAGADYFVAEMKKYGATVARIVGYSSDLTRAQEQATNVISQFRDAGVTSIAHAGDPLFPIFLTKEATRQTYFPEWLIMGTLLTDTTFFGRNYDQAQWSHAFGISPLWVFWVDVSTSSGYREYHHARPGSNRGDEGVSINVRRSWIQLLFTGIHMAGPTLTQPSFAQGMYNYPRSGGVPDAPLVFITPEHPMAIKDFTEVWWNPNGSGRDETGKDGPGTLMKVDGGKRWVTGSWPRGDPKVFVPEGAVYTKDFPQPEHEQDGHKHDPKQRCLSCK